MLKTAVITFIFFNIFSFVPGQTNSGTGPVLVQKIETSDLEEFRENPDFNYTEVEAENWLALFKEWLKRGFIRFLKYIFGNRLSEAVIANIFAILPYVAAFALLLVIVMLIVKGKISPLATDLSNPNKVVYTEEEALLNHPNLEGLAAEAIRNNDYRKALRFSYLICIKALSDQNQIVWQPDKTNSDYAREIREASLKPDFINITRWYNRVWYGNFSIEAAQFSDLQLSFDKFKNHPNSKK